MKSADVFREFYSKLVQMLPMDDAYFIASLYSNNLLPGNLKDEVKSKPTRADKVSHFLDKMIEPSIKSGIDTTFYGLLKVMEVCMLHVCIIYSSCMAVLHKHQCIYIIQYDNSTDNEGVGVAHDKISLKTCLNFSSQ